MEPCRPPIVHEPRAPVADAQEEDVLALLIAFAAKYDLAIDFRPEPDGVVRSALVAGFETRKKT